LKNTTDPATTKALPIMPAGQINPLPNALRAAQYVRMSTDHQQYSTQNQSDKIADYARQRNLEIVRTYADEGKSGVSIHGRDALKQLIADVQSGGIDFKVILVYDISRWGRFQDADESAYYEYICRRAGIAVTYCAEQFENDGSPVSTIVKGVKRAMAGEYSRELSTKVFVGQCRLIELGFRQGGAAGYGLRRVMIDQSGEFRGELKFGEHKSISTHRVVLVPGPEHEIQIVNSMYAWLIQENLTLKAIVRRLNDLGIPPHFGSVWTSQKVQCILTNEKYIGTNVYNKRSTKLRTASIGNPPEMWIRREDAHEGIVPKEVFFAAQKVFHVRAGAYTDEDLIDKLRQLLRQTGWLSAKVIALAPDMPACKTYSDRFGSLKRAYEQVGYFQQSNLEYKDINRRIRRMHSEILERTHAAIASIGGNVWRDPKTDLLHINQELVISVVLTRCHTAISGVRRWRIRFDPSKFAPDLTIVVRLNEANQAELDYFLLPKLDLPEKSLNILSHRESSLDCFRFDTLGFLYGMAARTAVVRPPRTVSRHVSSAANFQPH
jgi:DNA invertase Pin-like site-specific DNA recombinase